MKIEHRHVVSFDKCIKVQKYLDKNNIQYKLSSKPRTLVVKVYEDDKNWKKTTAFLKRNKSFSLTDTVYTQKELDDAEWLSIRSKFRWEYPQPEDDYQSITYDDKNYCDKCGGGLVQKGNFKVKRAPKWGNKFFLMLNWVHDELFVNDKAAHVLTKSDLKGFDILDVEYSKKAGIVEDIKQIKVNTILQPCIIFNKENVKKKTICNQCGSVRRITSGRGLYCAENAFKELDVDIVKSSEIFGDGFMYSRIIYISNNFYKLLTEKGLDKSLDFEPAFIKN